MRLAIIFSGFVGNIDVFRKNIYFRNFIDRYRPDCYFSIWDEEKEDLSSFGNSNILMENYGDVSSIFSKDLINKDSDSFLHSIRSQYYHVKKAFDSIPYPQNYDVIIRMRSYVEFKREFVIEEYKYMIDNDIPVLFSDWIVMGNSKIMNDYSKIYNSLIESEDFYHGFYALAEVYPVFHFAKMGYACYQDNSIITPTFVLNKC